MANTFKSFIHLDIFPPDFVNYLINNHIGYLQKQSSKIFIISLMNIMNNQSCYSKIEIAKKKHSKSQQKIWYSLASHKFTVEYTLRTVDWVSSEIKHSFSSWTELLNIYKPIASYNIKRYKNELNYLNNKIKFLEDSFDLCPPIEGGILFQKSKSHFTNDKIVLRKSM